MKINLYEIKKELSKIDGRQLTDTHHILNFTNNKYENTESLTIEEYNNDEFLRNSVIEIQNTIMRFAIEKNIKYVSNIEPFELKLSDSILHKYTIRFSFDWSF